MQQDTFYYHNFPQDPRLQYQNSSPFHAEANSAPWSSPENYIPHVNLPQAPGIPNPFNYNSQLHPNITPVSTADYSLTPTFSWAHTVPSLMPWVTQGDQNVLDPIMRFGAPFPPDPCTSQTATSWELLNNLGANKTNVNMHLKRKSDLDALEAAAPHKMCITEEKMAARLKELHISNQYSVPAENSQFQLFNDTPNSAMLEKSITNLQQFDAMIKGSDAEVSSKLVLAPELRKLVEPEKIFARTFIDKVERPSMAVVLWQPQNKLLTNANNNASNSKSDEKESSDGNLLSKGQNNNFLLPEVGSIGNPNLTDISETSSSLNSEDVMDT